MRRENMSKYLLLIYELWFDIFNLMKVEKLLLNINEFMEEYIFEEESTNILLTNCKFFLMRFQKAGILI